MFETENVIIHSITLRADDVIEIDYTQKRFMQEWGYKSEHWSFDRSAIADIEVLQLVESAAAILDLVEIKARGEA